jgi:hypothetical protein
MSGDPPRTNGRAGSQEFWCSADGAIPTPPSCWNKGPYSLLHTKTLQLKKFHKLLRDFYCTADMLGSFILRLRRSLLLQGLRYSYAQSLGSWSRIIESIYLGQKSCYSQSPQLRILLPPSPGAKNGLKLLCNKNIVNGNLVWELSRLWVLNNNL